MARGNERSKRIGNLQPGDRVRTVQPSGNARIISCERSACTMVKAKRSGPADPLAIGLIVVFEVIDGPLRGLRIAEILHPEDEVLL